MQYIHDTAKWAAQDLTCVAVRLSSMLKNPIIKQIIHLKIKYRTHRTADFHHTALGTESLFAKTNSYHLTGLKLLLF